MSFKELWGMQLMSLQMALICLMYPEKMGGGMGAINQVKTHSFVLFAQVLSGLAPTSPAWLTKSCLKMLQRGWKILQRIGKIDHGVKKNEET